MTEKSDPPFQKAKPKGWGTPEEKDKFKIGSSTLACATRQVWSVPPAWNTNGWTPQNKRYWPPGGHWYGEKMGPYENFTANNTQDDYLMVQTHELGHSLADITDVMVPFKGLPMRSDQDTGAWFVNCVEDAYHPPSQ
jgi:hypothetical protein